MIPKLTDNGTCVWLDGLVESSHTRCMLRMASRATTYRLYANFASDDVEVTAVYGTEGIPMADGSFYVFLSRCGRHGVCEWNQPGVLRGGAIARIRFWLAIGAAPGEDDQSNSVGMDAFTPAFEAGGALDVNTFLGGHFPHSRRINTSGSSGRKSPVGAGDNGWADRCLGQHSIA